MKRLLVLLSAAAIALPAVAQQQQSPAPAPAAPPKNVAVVNGEVLTAERFNYLWNNLGFSTRESYDKVGGKGAFLDTYVGKRLLIQEAIKSGFDKRPDVRTDME